MVRANEHTVTASSVGWEKARGLERIWRERVKITPSNFQGIIWKEGRGQK